jgi:hypothetical protein
MGAVTEAAALTVPVVIAGGTLALMYLTVVVATVMAITAAIATSPGTANPITGARVRGER